MFETLEYPLEQHASRVHQYSHVEMIQKSMSNPWYRRALRKFGSGKDGRQPVNERETLQGWQLFRALRLCEAMEGAQEQREVRHERP